MAARLPAETSRFWIPVKRCQYLLDANPGNRHHRRKHQHSADRSCTCYWTRRISSNKNRITICTRETDDSSARGGQDQCHDRDHRKQRHQENAFSAHLSQNQRHQRNGNDHFRETRKVIAVHIRPKRQSRQSALPGTSRASH